MFFLLFLTSITECFSESVSFAGIFFWEKRQVLVLLSRRNRVLKILFLNWSTGILLSVFFSWNHWNINFTFYDSPKDSNLSLNGVNIQISNNCVIDMLCEQGEIVLMETFWETDINLSSWKFLLSLSIILHQYKIFEKVEKFLHKTEVLILFRCNLLLLMFLAWKVLV